MNRQYYILRYRLNGGDSYLIWYSDEEDGVLVDAEGFVPSFKDISGLLKYAEEHNLSIDGEEPALLNLDVLGKWLKGKNVESVDPNGFNSAWNLFADMSRSINGGFDTDRKLTQKIYNKLFWGCNLSSITPGGKQYQPVWTKRELEIMYNVLGSGLQMFRSNVRSM